MLSDDLVYQEIIVNKSNALNKRHPFSKYGLPLSPAVFGGKGYGKEIIREFSLPLFAI